MACQRQRVALAGDILLDYHGVGTGRKQGAGEDAHRLAGCHGAIGCGAGGAFADDGPRTGQIVEADRIAVRLEEHTSELQSLMRISYAVFCLKKKNKTYHYINSSFNTT